LSDDRAVRSEDLLQADVRDGVLSLCTDRPLVVFDLETTGADKLNDRIVEIAAIRFSKPDGVAHLSHRVNPGVRIPRESTAFHGISDEDVKDLPRFAEVARGVAEFFDGCDLAGYSIRALDLPVLMKELERAGVPFTLEGRRIVDAQTIFFKKEPRDLAAALRFFAGREHDARHSAHADAVASAEVLAGELARYPDLPRDVEALHAFSTPTEGRFVDPDKRFFWRDGQAVFAFGEYRGRLLSDVAATHPAYLDWILNRDFPAETKRIAREAKRGVYPVRA
jgi:DNA polymerase-3 subunit epsilon